MIPRPTEDGAWSRLAWWVMRRPVAVLVPTLAMLLLLGTPFLHVRFNAPDARILPEKAPSRQAFDRLAEEFGPGPFAPIVLAIRTSGPATDPDNLARLFDYSRRLAADPRIARVDGLVDIDPRLTLAQYQLLYGERRSAGPVRRRDPAATTRGDLTGFTIFTPYGPNEAARAPWSGISGPARGRSRAGRHDGARRGRRRRRRGRRDRDRGGLPAYRGVHPRDHVPRPAAPPALAAPPAQGPGDELAVDRRRRSGRWSGSSRTATCRCCSGRGRWASSRPPSR